MRRFAALFLCALLLVARPVQAAEAPAALGALTLYAAGSDVAVENSKDYAVHVYAGGGTPSGHIALSVLQAGKTSLVYEGEGAALQNGRVLLCTLKAGCVAEVQADGAAQRGVLELTATRANAVGETDHMRLVFYVCIWLALVVFGSYLALVLAGRRARGRKKK